MSKFALCQLIVLALLLTTFNTFAAPRIGIVTMQPGEIFWERFGHNAIVVDDPAQAQPLSYNFGFFDLAEEGFYRNFVRGKMQYVLAVLPLEQDLSTYRHAGRGVSVQWLNLDDAQAQTLANALAENAKPENARYRYDYFTDNCSTRVRDAIDHTLGGELRRQLQTRSHGNTYRSEAVRLASPAWWMWLGFDVGLGPFADRPMSLWEDAFVPMHLANSLRDIKLADGRALVSSEENWLPHRIAPEPQASPRPWWPWALAGIAIAFALLWLGRCAPRALTSLAMPFWTLCATSGLLLVFIWGFTAHRAGWANHNLLLLNPLCLLLLPGAWRVLRGREPGAWFRRTLIVIAICAALALLLYWLPIATQRNAHWIALLLPIHVALAWVWKRR